MRVISVFQFASGILERHTSKELMIFDGSQLLVQVGGAFSNAQIKLEAKADKNGDWVQLSSVNLTDFSTQEMITHKGLYAFDVTGMISCHTVIESTDGEVNIFGRLTGN